MAMLVALTGIVIATNNRQDTGPWTRTALTPTHQALPVGSSSNAAMSPVDDHMKRADSILRQMPAAQIRSLPDTLLNFLGNYGSLHSELIRQERAKRRPKASGGGSSSLGYQRLMANVWPGKPLYLSTGFSYVGVIRDVESDHKFPDGSERDGVLVEFEDGSLDWIPRKTLQQIYVTK